MRTDWKLTVRGQLDLTDAEIAARIEGDGPGTLRTTAGDFVIAAESATATHLISSTSGIVQHYYAISGGQLYHGSTVADVVMRARLPRRDNWRAIGDLVAFGYVLGNATLHLNVQRLPRGTILSYANGRLSVDAITWEEQFPRFPATPASTLAAFDVAIERLNSPDAVISMSGGLDSRAILASCLSQGAKPPLLVMGMPHSSDVLVATQVARQEGLELEVVELDFSKYLERGEEVVYLTNGTKFPENWHTYFYVQASGMKGRPLLVGTNGEFARTYMVGGGPKGRVAAVLDVYPRLAHELFWRAYLQPTFAGVPPGHLTGAFAAEISDRGMTARRARALEGCRIDGRLRFLQGLDRYYFEQRVQNFMGNGIRLLAESVAPRLPFLDPAWMANASNLPRQVKQGSNWHRLAISERWPALMNLPEPGVSTRTAAHRGWRQWLPRRGVPAAVAYARYPVWLRSDIERDYLLDHRGHMAWLVDPKVAERLVAEHVAHGTRQREINFLHTMALWDQVISRAAG